jgi:hypothetical protein
MVTGQGFGMCIGGCNRLCPVATGYSLVALYSLSVSIKWRRDRWRSKHHIETGPQVWRLGVQVWTETWNP